MTLTSPNTRKPRPRRIAADDAHSWARNLRLGNPYGKLVLCMLTLYVDSAGHCFVGIETLAEDTELSIDTVRRRLAWLETVGAIARFPQWLDASGCRNSDGKGKRTTDIIRLLLSADDDEIERRARGENEATPQPEQSGTADDADNLALAASLGQHNKNIRNWPSVSPTPALAQPSHCGEVLESSNLEPESRDSPQAPLRGDVSVQDQGEEEKQIPGWDTFKTEYESDGDPIVRVSLAKQLLAALTADEVVRCTKAVRGLIAWRRAQKKPPSKPSAQTFIREIEAWASWIKHAPPDPPSPKPKHAIGADTPQFAALALCRAIARFAPFRPETNVYTYAGDIPAGAENLAGLVRFRGESKEPDRSDWTLERKDSKRYVAWCQRVKEWLGVWPEPHRYWLDAQGFIVPTVRDAEGYGEPGKLPRSLDGLLLPRTENGWPPPKSNDAKSTTPEDVHVERDVD